MKLLLDSHAVIWYVDQDHPLSSISHAASTDPVNDLFISVESVGHPIRSYLAGFVNLN